MKRIGGTAVESWQKMNYTAVCTLGKYPSPPKTGLSSLPSELLRNQTHCGVVYTCFSDLHCLFWMQWSETTAHMAPCLPSLTKKTLGFGSPKGNEQGGHSGGVQSPSRCGQRLVSSAHFPKHGAGKINKGWTFLRSSQTILIYMLLFKKTLFKLKLCPTP